jgi:hypothetical protein
METGTHQPFGTQRSSTDDVKDKAKHLTRTARERALSTLDQQKGQLGDVLERMADASRDDRLGGWVSDYARRGAELLRNRSAGEILESVRRNVRSRPALLLSASFVAGLAFARLMKGSAGGDHGDADWSEVRP